MRDRAAVMVTGGAGFIGSAVCRHLVRTGTRVVNVDKLTYAGNLASLAEIEGSDNYSFLEADIADQDVLGRLMRDEAVGSVMHLAAESHVDRSIDSPAAFIDTNITGTYRLLETALDYWRSLPGDAAMAFRFHPCFHG